LVVDDAIVVVENVERHLREGKTPFDAALLGARELVGPIIAMTITLAAVYAPIGLQGGLTGSLFREFAFTLAGAVAISGVVALTLSPMMSSKLLDAQLEHHWLPAHINAGFERLRAAYGRTLGVVLQNRSYVYAVWGFVSVLGLVMVAGPFTPKELAPAEDQGVIFGIVDAPADATLDQTSKFAAAAEKVFKGEPETDFVFQLTNPSSGFGGMVTKPWDQRKRSVFQIIPDVQQKLNAIPGIRMLAVTPPSLPGGGQFPVEFVLASTADTGQILSFAQQIAKDAVANKIFPYFPPIIDTKIDHLAAAVGGNYVNRFDIAGRSYKVIPQIKRVDRLNPDQLQNIYVTGPNGQLVPLSTIATIQNSTVPRSLNRFQQLNAVTISGVPGMPLDQALKSLESDAARILPKGYVIDYTGESRQLRKEGGNAKFWGTMGLAVILIFLVLAAQFNSFRDPLVILGGSVPLALFGASIFMFLKNPNPNMPFFTNGWTTTFNIYSQVGLVTLVGLIAKNGILIVEFANRLQEQGKAKLAAIHEASLTRLRPILMTTVATVAGHFPLTLVTGAGAAARNSIGLVLVGGMSIGTVFTLFVVPSIYMLLAKDHSRHRAAAASAKSILQPQFAAK